MKKIFLLMILSFLTTAVFGCENNHSKEDLSIEKNVSAKVDDKKAVDFKLKTPDGKEIKLSDYRGKVVLLDFWATWCPPCRKGIPDLISIQNEFKDDVIVIGVSLDQGKTIKDVEPFMKNYGINYPVVLGDQKIAMDYGNIQAIPTSFIIDQNGNIVDKHVGLVEKSVYVNKIKKLLNKS